MTEPVAPSMRCMRCGTLLRPPRSTCPFCNWQRPRGHTASAPHGGSAVHQPGPPPLPQSHTSAQPPPLPPAQQ